MDAISCIAVRCVTIAACLAISPAPSASVTCMTTGSATGTAAMRIDRQSEVVSTTLWPRSVSTTTTAMMKSSESAMTISQTSMILVSNTDCVGFVLCCMSIAAEPISE